MYAALKLAVQPSAALKQFHYLVHAGLLLACLHSLYISGVIVLLIVLPLLFIQWHFLKKLQQRAFIYFQSRQWCFDLNRVELEIQGHKKQVEFRPVHIFNRFVIIQFKESDIPFKWWQSQWRWDVITQQDCQIESFRQFKAMLRMGNYSKDAV